MIAYFSGTGNSLYAAKKLGSITDDKVISISRETLDSSSSKTYDLEAGERLGIVFPVYSWAAPDIIIKWLSESTFNFKANPYIYIIITCGEDIGNALKPIEKLLLSKKLRANLSYSLAMPNNYMIMGDVFDKNTEKKLLMDSERKLDEIGDLVKKYTFDIVSITRGSIPAIKTGLINPLFNKFARDSKNFNVNNKCISCGICQQICPNATITLKDSRPVWSGYCSQCLACLNYCPPKAINYGSKTINKGRYTNPNIGLDEMKMR